MAKTFINFQWNYLSKLVKATLRDKPKEVSVVQILLHHLFLFTDYAYDIYGSLPRGSGHEKGARLTVRAIQLIIRDYLSFMYNLLMGNYWGAGRDLRAILETAEYSSVAVVCPSQLDPKYPSTRPIGFTEFSKWLVDKSPGKFKTRKALSTLGLKPSEAKSAITTYRKLCALVHPSVITMKGKKCYIPDTVLNYREFDRVFSLATRVMDVTLFCFLKSFQAIISPDEFDDIVWGYSDWLRPPEKGIAINRLDSRRFPITSRLVKHYYPW